MKKLYPPQVTPLEIWGGAECSFVRVGDRFSDQFALAGHDGRSDDLDRFASLGVRALRYPISWERMMTGRIDWDWAARRLDRLAALGVRPIVGFVHHGGGPLPEGLLDPDFAPRLAEFAHAVAKRFPWIDAYTPVNEPLTTARFSGLYGIWHPHRRDDATFVRGLLHEVEGTGQAMRAIRAVRSDAQLVQTEDVGKTHATPLLDYQADFENERRWLSFDLLCGCVDEQHSLIGYLRSAGATDLELESLRARPCPPDVLGMNYYITSERFLDHRLHHHPAIEHGGNGRHAYADVVAARVRQEGAIGPSALLREFWTRYHLPVAITEVQLACTREEQLRWLLDVWHGAHAARNSGVDVRAVTPWALLGAYEWDSLLTEARGTYESGAFDLRAPVPRPTAVARAIKALAATGNFTHPVLSAPGWWHRPDRYALPAFSAPRTGPAWAQATPLKQPIAAPVLVVGARGRLGRAFLSACSARAVRAVAITREDGDLTQQTQAGLVLARHRPWAVINCAGFTGIDAAESELAACERDNVMLATTLGDACRQHEVKFLTFSTDQVFDGEADQPYVESDAVRPLSVYARSKHEAEQRILALASGALIVRPGALFDPTHEKDFVARIVHQLAGSKPILATADQIVSPTSLKEFVNAALDLLIDDETGLWHLANSGGASWFDWAREVARLAGHSVDRVQRAAASTLGWTAPRPRFSALRSERGDLLGPWQQALSRYLAVHGDGGADLAA